MSWTQVPAVALWLSSLVGTDLTVDFTRDVRPILSNHCFKCHGPDEETREGGLRLDDKASAEQAADSGERAIVPGKPDESELVRRILATDADVQMPPASTNKPLSDAQKKTLQDWIAQGAEYKPHWAFVPPTSPPVPVEHHPAWHESPVDAFIAQKQIEHGLTHQQDADRWTLARRLSLDLVGLPPAPEEATSLVEDAHADALERFVDRLLASPTYGERWARPWLDLARYADTNGFEKDRPRSIWPWRDWVIESLNADMPFDQFTIEQLAGDLLEKPTQKQRIATGFHRNTMLNEEGGIDPLEYRYYSMVDRVNTTGTVWLGLTLGCCQCHTHKYDPLTQTDYYRVMALLNNADEPEYVLDNESSEARRQSIEDRIRSERAQWPSRFPMEPNVFSWTVAKPHSVASAGGATAQVLDDGAVLLSGARADKDAYTFTIDVTTPGVSAIRLEALADPSLPNKGPGRADNGNFVLGEVVLTKTAEGGAVQPIPIASVIADAHQDQFEPAKAIDGKPETGWAIHTKGDWNRDRTLVLILEKPLEGVVGTTLHVTLDQGYGGTHTLGKFRVSTAPMPAEISGEKLPEKSFNRAYEQWLASTKPLARHWTTLRPIEARSNLPLLTILEDNTVLSTGDQTKSDAYEVVYEGSAKGVRALRIEAMIDDRLPRSGPGRIYYEGPIGDFLLSEFWIWADGKRVKFTRARETFAAGTNTAAMALDRNPQTGWSINGRQGEPHVAVFETETPIDIDETIDFGMIFERYYPAGMGRFRLSYSTEPLPESAGSVLPADVEASLLADSSVDPAVSSDRLRNYFMETDPRLASEREKVAQLRESIPAPPTTLVFAERPANNPRPTHVHKRGEYLQTTTFVRGGVPASVEPASQRQPQDRLAFARWLVDPSNPLTARVTVNRHWQILFGRGIVATTEDFGFQGSPPSHPELLDWLAIDLTQRGWSIKALHRELATSRVYRQRSDVTAESASIDALNIWLTHSPRVRLEGELVRDVILSSAGSLTHQQGGPSVFPPQPPGVTAEGTYGPLAWKVSEGADRYRRGLYTFAKRTAPYAMFNTFDGPSGEACLARREVSNTPLQALTMLNDDVVVGAARHLSTDLAKEGRSFDQSIDELFLRCLTRRPTESERKLLFDYSERQRARIMSGELSAKDIAGVENVDRAVWTLLARTVFNLDEMIVKS